MNTIVETVVKEEYAKIADGSKNFILHKSKVEPAIGQRLLMIEEGFTGKEILTVVGYVGKGPGLFKDHYVVQFPYIVAGPVIDMTQLNMSTMNIEL